MINRITFSKLIPFLVVGSTVVLFVMAFIRGNLIVQKSEKELNPEEQNGEAQAKEYILKEIDAKTGQLRWKLTAREGESKDNLQGVLIKDINAEVYKNNSIVFKLFAPYAKANAESKEILLFGEVVVKDNNENFLLTANELSLGMGTSIEAQKGFNLTLKDSGTVKGDSALINDDQSQIIVKKLQEGQFKDIILSGENVYIEKSPKGEISKARISNNGRIILKNKTNDNLSAETIIWTKDGKVEAINNVVYNSEDKVFKAGYLLINPDKKVSAKNNVNVTHGQTRCYGDSLIYENNSLVVITGRPKAIQGDKQIIADKIVYDITNRKVQALGNVKTIVGKTEDTKTTKKS